MQNTLKIRQRVSAQGIEHSFSFVFFSFPVVVILKSVRKSEVSQPDFL